jgi:hypothetical protein
MGRVSRRLFGNSCRRDVGLWGVVNFVEFAISCCWLLCRVSRRTKYHTLDITRLVMHALGEDPCVNVLR